MYNFVEKIVQLACSTTTTRNEDETEQNRKSSFSSLILLLQTQFMFEKCYHHAHYCICVRLYVYTFSPIHKYQRKCVKWRKKIKSPFFAYCTEKKKQLISLLQTFNTAPPDNIRAGEDKKLCVQCVFVLLCSIIKWFDCCHITHRQVCDLTVL